mgnify:CR=1 FL=1
MESLQQPRGKDAQTLLRELALKRQQRQGQRQTQEVPTRVAAPPPQEEEVNIFTDVLAAPLRGVEGFVQNAYNLGDMVVGDALPDYNNRFLGRSQTSAGQVVEGVSQFLTGFIPVLGPATKLTQAVGLGSKLAPGMLAGGVADFVGFDGLEGRLSNMIQQVPALRNPVTEYLAAQDDDTELEGRLKNAIEGLGLGGAAEMVFRGVKALKGARRDQAMGDDPDVILDNMDDRLSGELAPRNLRQRTMLGRLRMKATESLVDQYARQAELQDQTGGGMIKRKGPLKTGGEDSADAYMAKRVAAGRIFGKNKQLEKVLRADGQAIRKIGKRMKMDPLTINKRVDDYLHAKHAKRYNAEMLKRGESEAGLDGVGSGMSDEYADQVIKDFENSPLMEIAAPIVESRRSMSQQILDELLDGGLVSQKQYDQLREMYPDYVPLNRIMDDEADYLAMETHTTSGKAGTNEAKSTGVKKGMGSYRDADVSQNIYTNLKDAIRRAEINKANIALGELAKRNKDVGILKVRKAKRIGTRDGSGAPIYDDKPNVLTYYDKGQRMEIEVTDPDLARALKGTPKSEMGPLLKASYLFNRYLGSIYTAFNPNFVVPNKFRDSEEAFFNGMAKMGWKKAFGIVNPARVTQDMRIVLRNIMGRGDPVNNLDDSLYERFVKGGGSTGGLSGYALRNLETELDKISETVRSNPAKFTWRKFKNFVDKTNEVFEDSTRFTTYRQMIKAGKSEEQAIMAARNSSFDPLVSGRHGDTLKALFLFSNPAIQSTRNFWRSIKNPKVATTLAGTMIGSQLAIDRWNRMIDEDWRAKVPDWQKNKNFVIVRGKDEEGNLKLVNIPAGYAMIPFKMAGEGVARLVAGDEIDPVTFARRMTRETLSAYNPAGGSLIPTPLRTYADLLANRDGLGRQIRPEFMEDQMIDNVERRFSWTQNTFAGELSITLAEQLKNLGIDVSPENIEYLYDTYFGGPGKTMSNILTIGADLVNGKPIESRNIPIWRRFFGESSEERVNLQTGELDRVNVSVKETNSQRAREGRLAYQIYDKMKETENPQDRMLILRSEAANSPGFNERVYDRIVKMYNDDLLGLTKADKQRRNLRVDARAKNIMEELQSLGTPQERLDFLADQQRKGIITQSVSELLVPQLRFLRAQGAL